MSLEDKELGELSQIENNTYCVSSLTRGIKKIPSIEAESRQWLLGDGVGGSGKIWGKGFILLIIM
jgi:hypothetical protein